MRDIIELYDKCKELKGFLDDEPKFEYNKHLFNALNQLDSHLDKVLDLVELMEEKKAGDFE